MQAARTEEFTEIKSFYWNLIDRMDTDKIGWKKGIYPTDAFLTESMQKGELYTLREKGALCACVILNEECNEGYNGLPWCISCEADEIWIPHALAVDPSIQGKGIGRRLMAEIRQAAKQKGKKVIRLDILGTNERAERLYRGAGFRFVAAKEMFYEDTGWTEYKMFELDLT